MSEESAKGRYSAPEGSRTWEYLAAFSCSIAALCLGCIVGWNSPSSVKLTAPDSPIAVTVSQISTMAALVAVGHMLAPPISGAVVDRIGRKNTLLLSGLPLVLSWSMIIVARSVAVLYVARFLSGITLGGTVCVCPMYLGEIASVKLRGAVGAAVSFMFNLGIFFAFLVGPYLSVPALSSVFLGISVAFVVSFWFMPESPYYLAMVGRVEEAEEALEKLRGKSDVTEELESITSSSKDKGKSRERVGMKELFAIRGNRKALLILLIFVSTHHFGGYFSIITYGQLIFREMGDLVPDHLATIAMAGTQLVGSVLTTFLVERTGRKPLIFCSGFLCAICTFLVGMFFYARDYMERDVSPYASIPFVATIVYVFAFTPGLVSVQLILASEVFVTDVKALGTCILGVVGGVLGTVGVKLYVLLAVKWGFGHSVPFLGFSVILTLCTVLLMRLAPETKGKTLVQIQKELNE
ncbi:facilitated trehalose transporter Tret1 [Orussus abietinus]|uniref:facilitated trehalose transporter Tret1 n=1 Tax=Orussus abietinus TaxID=222816 RepID=UPI000625307E|nr:facilitated trehalose transporter Tret1 [Orussus abietinus]